MAKSEEYLAIKVWGVRNRQADSQIRVAQLLAQDDDAPLNSIYKFEGNDESDSRWMTTDDINDDKTRDQFHADIAELKAKAGT